MQFGYVLEEIFQADIITVHVPLTLDGTCPTRHMVDDIFVSKMKPGSILINSSRGAVAHTKTLHQTLDSGKLEELVLDVWENEPNIDLDLWDKVYIGTQHIAGHSFDGKVNGTKMLYDAVCDHLGVHPPGTDYMDPQVRTLELVGHGQRHPAQGVLGGGVGALLGVTLDADN